jgi:hypothetical protein
LGLGVERAKQNHSNWRTVRMASGDVTTRLYSRSQSGRYKWRSI